MKINISKSLKIGEAKNYFKNLFWLFLGIFIILNIILFYFLNGIIYFITIIIGNVILFWIMIPIIIWIGKTFLIDKSIEIAGDIKESIIEEVVKNNINK